MFAVKSTPQKKFIRDTFDSAYVLRFSHQLNRLGFGNLKVLRTEEPCAHIVDNGRIEVASDPLDLEAASMSALRKFRSMLKAGWPICDAGGQRAEADFVLIDAGY